MPAIPQPHGIGPRMMSNAAHAPEAAVEQPQLAVSGVSKRFGGVRAVEDVTVAVAPGEIVSIIGPNGAGKTTLVNIISATSPANGPRASPPWASPARSRTSRCSTA
jgi:ABC-type molybdenum transport system ATPase subunit/photorepair protein PhrA